MTLYSKNGSIPYPTKDETEGWIEVEEAPIAGEGEEVVWWYPPGWIVRPVQPVKEGYKYSWSQSEGKWNEYAEQPVVTETIQALTSEQIQSLATDQIQALTTAQIAALE